MFNQQATIFPKQIKLDDYEPYENNHLIILESSNLLLGSGSRSSTASLVLAKCLQYLMEEGELQLKSKSLLELGSGVGLLSVYLAALGCNIIMTDVPAMKQLAERNSNINRKQIEAAKGKIEFFVASWKKTNCLGCKSSETTQTMSSASSDKSREVCLYHLKESIDLTIVCECGGISDLESQIYLMGKEGMILAYLKREGWDDSLDDRSVEELFLEKEIDYERISSYHPDYIDDRVSIWRLFSWKADQKNYQPKAQITEEINPKKSQQKHQQQESSQKQALKIEINKPKSCLEEKEEMLSRGVEKMHISE